MTTARDIMHAAARRMRGSGVGALPIWVDDDSLHGMLTDRDFVIKCIAAKRDPHTTTVGASLEQHQVRRLPVIDPHRLVGCVPQPTPVA